MKTKARATGWKPDIPDIRDKVYKARKSSRVIPDTFDMRDRFPKCWHQGTLGSCTAQAVAGACIFLDIYDDDVQILVPSRLFIYYNTRVIENSVKSDDGAYIRNAIKSVVKYGYPDESKWPYKISKFRWKPRATSYKHASKEKISVYSRVPRNLDTFKSIISGGVPIILGFSVYDSVYTLAVEKTGYIPVPQSKDKLTGGHAVLLVGYTKRHFIFRNSWGTDWGDNGYGYLPNKFIENSNLSDDFWIVG